MNPLYMAVVNAIVGRRRRCPACRKEQIVDRLSKDGSYHCKKCGHRITKKELSATKPYSRH